MANSKAEVILSSASLVRRILADILILELEEEEDVWLGLSVALE